MTYPRTVKYPDGRTVVHTKPKADDHGSPERKARRAKRRAAKKAAS